MELEFDGKTVLVTGGSDGLGRALCHRLVAEGATVAFCGRDAERIEATRSSLEAAGGDVLGVSADVTKAEDIARFVEAALERWGRIDGVVNNAGKSAAKPLTDTTDEDFDGAADLLADSLRGRAARRHPVGWDGDDRDHNGAGQLCVYRSVGWDCIPGLQPGERRIGFDLAGRNARHDIADGGGEPGIDACLYTHN